MIINQEKCTSCETCVPYCPLGAIEVKGDMVDINQEECVECGVCYRLDLCPSEAIEPPELKWPRVLRSHYSDPSARHPDTQIMGRGTMEMKTNDVSGRFCQGEVGFGVEVGRPNTGTRLRDVEKVGMAIAKVGVQWETEGNPTYYLMTDPASGKMRDDVLEEKVLSAIHEFKTPLKKLKDVLEAIEKVSKEVDTVLSVCIITKLEEDGSIPNAEKARELGYNVAINPKVNVGLGRPLFDFEKGGNV
ncbi:MAG: 4Fe-4S binding protein [Dethiobacter sp.]|jgi:NAD-dependent dihydropyrimidine dehydrogenase PreA subunit|nr:4Fe-4S binding protein [Dethiobacter sp.]